MKHIVMKTKFSRSFRPDNFTTGQIFSILICQITQRPSAQCLRYTNYACLEVLFWCALLNYLKAYTMTLSHESTTFGVSQRNGEREEGERDFTWYLQLVPKVNKSIRHRKYKWQYTYYMSSSVD